MANRERIAAWEARVLIWICLAAALRVFLLCAAFPLFNNVDETMHADLVRKYARGHVPRSVEPYDPGTAERIVLYGSPEYYYRRELFDRDLPPPVWSLPAEVRARFFDRAVAVWRERINPESTQQPVYYAAAALWYRLGLLLGARDGGEFYWIRFLNIAVVVLLIGLAYAFLRRAYPESPYLRLGVPILLAVLPQDTFFSINSDVLSPLFFTAAFYGLLEVRRAARPSLWLCAGTGLAAALAVLTKLSNVAVLGVLAVVALLRCRGPRREPARLAALCGAALVPVAAWAWRDWLLLGDPTGSAAKARLMGWTPKTVGTLLQHPLLTPSGLVYFFSGLLRSFWRGEFYWHGARLAAQAPALDRFYPVSSVVLLACAAYALRDRREPRRFANAMSFLALGLGVLFLAALSMAYDFGGCAYPSRARPYFISGRLLGGATIPFLALYLDGLERLLARFKSTLAPWAALAAIVLLLAGGEAWLTRDVFSSAYNWFHLP